EGGVIVPGATATYQFVLAGNRTLVANYSLIPPTQFAVIVSSSPVLGGVTTGAGLFNEGSSVTVTATPNAGFTFANWTEGGVIVPGATATYQFVIANDRTLVANYVPVQFTIALSSSPLLGGTTGGAGTFDTGTTRTVTATAAVGYDFANWTEGGVIVPGAGASYEFVLTGNRTLVANFVVEPPLQFTVVLNADPNNGGVVTGAGSFDAGSLVTVSANANQGYTFVNWTENGVIVPGANEIYEFVIANDRTLQANFILDTVATGPGIIDLGTAGDFVILSKSGIDRVGVTSITGNIGVSPIDQTAITGFSQIMDVTNTFSTSIYVNGKIYAADYTAPTPAYLTTAVSDMETAFVTANGLTTDVIVALGAGDISGMTLAPGLYKWDTGLLITNEGVTLSGGPDDTWVFQISDDFTVNNDAIITLAGGAQAKNIFWVTRTQALLGSNVQFQGNILAQTLISVNTGTSVIGKLLSQTAVTLNAATVVDQN
ncbi:MAG: ice-binding family protein, partial [Lutibacter sp.]|nr:ice-binding family protein [Lutibacter sp.]